MAQPEIVFRHGTCRASVFENEYKRGSESFSVKSVAFQHSYRDKNGEWQTSNSLRANDIPKAILVLEKAYDYVTSNGREDEEVELAA